MERSLPNGILTSPRRRDVTRDEVATSRARLTGGHDGTRAWTATDPRRTLKQ